MWRWFGRKLSTAAAVSGRAQATGWLLSVLPLQCVNCRGLVTSATDGAGEQQEVHHAVCTSLPITADMC
jgi:hypothetical protein